MSATPPAQRVKLGGPVELAAVNRSGRPALCSISAIRAITRWWSPAVWTDPISQSIQARLPARIGVRLRGLGLHLAPTYLSALDLANDAGCSTCPPALTQNGPERAIVGQLVEAHDGAIPLSVADAARARRRTGTSCRRDRRETAKSPSRRRLRSRSTQFGTCPTAGEHRQ
jgi:hypothetical protein